MREPGHPARGPSAARAAGALAALLAGAWAGADEKGPSALNVTLGREVLVAQTNRARLPWGVWQFPNVFHLGPKALGVAYQRFVDNAALDSAAKHRTPGLCVSNDAGATWRPAANPLDRHGGRGMCRLADGDLLYLAGPGSRNVPRSKLPPGTRVRHGYGGYYTIRDPLKMPEDLGRWHVVRRPAGGGEWTRRPAVIHDPDGGVYSYDPPGKDYAVVHWQQHMRVVQLPDGSLLAVFYGWRLGPDRKPRPKCESWCLRSVDGGRRWTFHGVIARDDRHRLAGFTEPTVAVLADGSLLAVLRTECARTGPMYRTWSEDAGRTWSKPGPFFAFGVLPNLLRLPGGVIVLSFGRPGAHLLFARDGRGRAWERPTTLVSESFEGTGVRAGKHGLRVDPAAKGKRKQTRTSGYTSLLAVGRDSFLVAYDQFDRPDETGRPRKAILIRRVKVSTKPLP